MSQINEGTPAAGPDVSVRVAWADDAAAIARVQVAAWHREYADLLPREVLDSFDPDRFAAVWHQSLTRPEDARNRVLVALDRQDVRGFAVTSPSPDPDSDPVADGEVVELVVHPEHGRAGHGSRLLHACVDTLRADRFVRGTMWLNATDDVRRRFVTESGWATDGAHRELDLHGDGSVKVKQVRLHTDLRPE
jgi:ribosomal protein S18 acetylase RimI-like enzyme